MRETGLSDPPVAADVFAGSRSRYAPHCAGRAQSHRSIPPEYASRPVTGVVLIRRPPSRQLLRPGRSVRTRRATHTIANKAYYFQLRAAAVPQKRPRRAQGPGCCEVYNKPVPLGPRMRVSRRRPFERVATVVPSAVRAPKFAQNIPECVAYSCD